MSEEQEDTETADKVVDTISKEDKDSSTADDDADDKKKTSPPEGYTCKLCGISGHWIQQCSKKTKNKKRKSAGGGDGDDYKYEPGVEPSPKDIDRAREMQKLKPPKCDCGIPSRVKKVKRSKVKDNSRAVGSYFFFCTKKKEDVTKCNFAEPVEDLQKSQKEKSAANFFAKKRKGF